MHANTVEQPMNQLSIDKCLVISQHSFRFHTGGAAPGSEPLPGTRSGPDSKNIPYLGEKFHNSGHPKRSRLRKHTLMLGNVKIDPVKRLVGVSPPTPHPHPSGVWWCKSNNGTLKEQQNHYSKVYNGEREVVSPNLHVRFDYGSANNSHALATTLGKIIPIFYPEVTFSECGCVVLQAGSGNYIWKLEKREWGHWTRCRWVTFRI